MVYTRIPTNLHTYTSMYQHRESALRVRLRQLVTLSGLLQDLGRTAGGAGCRLPSSDWGVVDGYE